MGTNRILNKLEDWAVKSTSLKAMIRGSKYSVCSCTSQSGRSENRTTTWGQEQKKISWDLLLLCPSVDPSSMFRDDGLPRSSKPENLKKSRPKKLVKWIESISKNFLDIFHYSEGKIWIIMKNIKKKLWNWFSQFHEFFWREL